MWDHLYPCRTQKLSTYTPKVLVWRRTGRIGSCWLEPYICKALIFCCSFTFDLYELCLYIEVAKMFVIQLDKVVAPQPETDNYITLLATEEKLEIACSLPDGTEIDRNLLKK